jgi:hypothetical protein
VVLEMPPVVLEGREGEVERFLVELADAIVRAMIAAAVKGVEMHPAVKRAREAHPRFQRFQ